MKLKTLLNGLFVFVLFIFIARCAFLYPPSAYEKLILREGTHLVALSITSPKYGTTLYKSEITLSGTAYADTGHSVTSVSVRQDKGEWRLAIATGTTNWKKALDLVLGTNTIDVRAIGDNGVTNTTNWVLVYQNIFVALSIYSPKYGAILHQANITLSGTASADGGHFVTSVVVRPNGGLWELATGTTNWTQALTLAPGMNTIDMRAIANNGLTNTTNWTLVYSPPFTQIAAGTSYSLALMANGTLYATGANSSGQLGTNTSTANTNKWIHVLNGVKAIAAGWNHSLAISNGTLYVTGDNGSGQLGTGDTANIQSWTNITNISGVKAIAAGTSHSLALKNDGTLYATGDNSHGQLGTNNTTIPSLTNWTQVFSNVQAIAAGRYHSLAVTSNGTLYATGMNSSGQLGIGTNTNISVWTKITNISGVQAIAAGTSHSLALTTNGILYATGYNYSGQLGTGNNNGTNSWTQVLTGVQAIAAGGNHSLAIKNDTLYVTGDNSSGQLGTENTNGTNSWTPVLSNIQAISAGGSHSLAISNGTLYVTGYNSSGQLGTGNTNDIHIWTNVSP